MCGIVGVYRSSRHFATAANAVERMKEAIRHRGPDSEGRYRSDFVDVGFRRLSIIDLSSGDQPLSNEDGSIQCFLNGEIYNYLELRSELVARGHQFKTSSDTEVLPHMYEEYGVDMFRRLNGMFAICLIDVNKREVLLARDRFGVKQLYYSDTSAGLVFGSEMKGLLASGLVRPEVDEAGVLSYLALFYCPEPNTLVRGVKKLPAGSWMRLVAEGSPVPETYYQVPNGPNRVELDLEEAAEKTKSLLWRSVQLQLQADVPVGISLSGGIDSSALACAAMQSQISGPKPMALTIHWPDTPADEVASAKELCKHLGMKHEVLEIPLGDFLQDLPLLGWISDEPVADPATYSQYCVSQAAAKFVKVLLGGAGGDELFGGYGIYKLSKTYSAYEKLPKALQQGLSAILAGHVMNADAMKAVMEYRDSRLLWHSRAKSNISSDEEAIIRKAIPSSHDPFANFAVLFQRYREFDAVNQQMVVDFQTYLPEQILTMMDRATMAASIEGRVPFLDNDLVDFAYSLSAKTKLGKPFDGKRVLKRAIANDVSPTVLSRRKLGMPSPFRSLVTSNFAAIRGIILANDSYVKSVLPESWLQEMTASENQALEHFRALYATLTLEIWHRLFIREQIYTRPDVGGVDLFEIPAAYSSN